MNWNPRIGTRSSMSLLVLLGLTACTEEQPEQWTYLDEGTYILSDSHANGMRKVEFFGTDEDGLSWGFDLDDRISEDGEEESCGHGDLTDAEGREGIDNQMAKIWDIIEPVAGVTAQGALQSAINEGRFLIMLEIVGSEGDLRNAKGVTLNVFQGEGEPEIGTFDLISPNQTFSIDPDAEFSSLENLSITDGVLEAGPLNFSIPVDIFGS